MQDFTDELPPASGMFQSDITAHYATWSITDLIAVAHVVTQESDYADWVATNGAMHVERDDLVYSYKSGHDRPEIMCKDDFRDLVSEQLYTLRTMNKEIKTFLGLDAD